MSTNHGKAQYEKLISQHINILRNLQYDSGLFAASSKTVGTGYDKSWIRDNFYECLAFEVLGEWDVVEKTYTALLNVFLKHEDKIDWAIRQKPQEKYQYIHARVDPETFEEFWEEWGNKQNDSIGSILFTIARLELHHKKSILVDEDHFRIVNKLVRYLGSIQYWIDEDNGVWEEDEEIHASSVGACVAGLELISKVPGIEVHQDFIDRGKHTLRSLLPRESKRLFVDLALLSLIWPYDVVTKEEADEILKNVEYHLLKNKGVIRHKNDYYYNANEDGYSEDAEWCFGLSWLAIIYQQRGEKEKTQLFIDKMLQTDTPQGIPELYFSNTDTPNENTPLGWAESLFIVALYNMNHKILKGHGHKVPPQTLKN